MRESRVYSDGVYVMVLCHVNHGQTKSAGVGKITLLVKHKLNRHEGLREELSSNL